MKNIISRIRCAIGGVCTINGVTYKGTDIQVTGDGKVIIDGKEQEQQLVQTVNITVHGDSGDITNTSGCVQVNNCQSVKTVSGDVEVRNDVYQNVQTVSGDVRAHDIYGAVKTVSGDIVGAR